MNSFEQIGRESKAQSIARKIWAHMPRELRTDQRLPSEFAIATPEQRRAWADVAAGKPVKKVPSDLTWARVVEILGEKVADERHWLSQAEEPRAAS